MYRILNTKPTPLETIMPGLDPELPQIIERAMLKEPDQRYQDLEHLREDFAALRNRLVGSGSGSGALDGDADTAGGPAEFGRRHSPARRRCRSGARGDVRSPGWPGIPRRSDRRRSHPRRGRYAPGSAGEPTVPARAAPRRTGRLVLAGATAAALIVILAVAFYRTASPDRPPAAASGDATPPALSQRRRRHRGVEPDECDRGSRVRIGGRSTSASARSAPPRGDRSRPVSVRSCSTR